MISAQFPQKPITLCLPCVSANTRTSCLNPGLFSVCLFRDACAQTSVSAWGCCALCVLGVAVCAAVCFQPPPLHPGQANQGNRAERRAPSLSKRLRQPPRPNEWQAEVTGLAWAAGSRHAVSLASLTLCLSSCPWHASFLDLPPSPWRHMLSVSLAGCENLAACCLGTSGSA